MTRDLDFARQSLNVAAARFAEFSVEYGPDHPRTRDARESKNGWLREVARLERLETEPQVEGYDSVVDRLMSRGYDRVEAERVALEIIMEDAA